MGTGGGGGGSAPAGSDELDSEGFLLQPRGGCGAGGAGAAAARWTDPSLRALSWKREGLSDELRFERSYRQVLASGLAVEFEQRPFGPEGFASTVWDSSIVASRWAERQGAGFWEGAPVLELGAGCGLLACTLAALGAAVVATDLPPNLPLLQKNCEAFGRAAGLPSPEVAACEWGVRGGAAGRGGWSWVVGCDLMYIEEAVPSLVDTLLDCTGGADTPDPQVRVLFAFGRNSQAQHAFEAEMRAHRFTQHRLSARELHPDYAPLDVKVFEWRRLVRPARNRSRVG